MFVLNATNSYILDFEKIDSRLDFAHYHPSFSYLDSLEDFTTFQVLKIKDICKENIISGTTPKNIKYDNQDGIEFIGASHVFDTGIKESNKKVSKDYLINEMKSLTVQKGDVLVSIAGTVGRASVYEKDKKSVISQSIARIRLNEKIALNKYVSLFLNSKIGKDIFLKYRHDVGQPNINTEELKELPIILPKDIQTQQKIVDKVYPLLMESKNLEKGMNIDTIYNIIVEELGFDISLLDIESLYFKTDKEKTSIHYRFIEELDNRLDFIHYSPKLDILKKLEKPNFITLEEVATKPLARGVQPKYNNKGNGIVVKTSSLKNIYLDCDNASKIDFDFSEDKSAILSKNDIVISSTGIKSLGKIDKFNCNVKAIADGHISIISLDESKYDIDFIVYFLRSILGQLQIEKYWSGSSGQIELNIREVGKIVIPSHKLISKQEQIKIAKNITKKLDEYINSEIKKKELKIKAYQIFKEEIFNK